MGKTVTTYLIDGDPKGTQYSFISNKICQMFVIPRSNLAYLNEQEKQIQAEKMKIETQLKLLDQELQACKEGEDKSIEQWKPNYVG